jgi:hypothetical protein
MKKCKTFLMLLICLLPFGLLAQQAEFIITVEKKLTKSDIQAFELRGFKVTKKIFDQPIMYLIRATSRNSNLPYKKIANLPNVLQISENREADFRTTEPNDARYEDQWHLVNIKADEAWDLATSGVTPHGDTIVLAIFDQGIEIDHPDLRDNIWKNRGEIPNDNIDNDANGYIDDFIGLNLHSGKDDHFPKSHGTEVVGVMGARGDNEIGISGVSWNSKILPISKSQGSIFDADMIESLNYIIQQRRLYNETNGAQGAFVVAINISIGFLRATASDHPGLCAAFEELGRHGILGVTATANEDFDVDTEGDVPAVCPSEYQISVTGSDRSNELMRNVAFGKQHIDVAAPGDEILTTALGRNYGERSGTSLATPQVAGAVALMYMAASDELMQLIRVNPSSGALAIREILLSTAEENNTLINKVASGGRLDLGTAVRAAHKFSNDPAPETLDLFIQPTLVEQTLDFQLDLPTQSPVEISIFDLQGRLIYHFTARQPLLQGLNEYQINMTPLFSGIYFMTATQDGQRVMKRFVKVGE